MIKKIIFLAFTFLNISAVAQTFTYNGINYNILDFFPPKVEVGTNPNFVGVANIPATVMFNNQSYQVTRLGYNAFRNCSGLTSITIPDSVIISKSFFCLHWINIVYFSKFRKLY